MLIYGKYVLIGFSYYKIIVEGYDAYQKGNFAYEVLSFPFTRKRIKDQEEPPTIIVVEEKDDFLIIS